MKKQETKVNNLLEESGLQVDNRMYYDPIYKSSMYRDFLRALYNSKHKRIKILFSLFFLIIPALIADVIFTFQAFVHSDSVDYGNKIGTLFYLYPLSLLVYTVAIKLILSALLSTKHTH